MCSDEVFIRVEIISVVVTVSIANNIVKLHLVAEEAANATEALDELEAVGALVCDELDLNAVALVVQAEPVGQLLA